MKLKNIILFSICFLINNCLFSQAFKNIATVFNTEQATYSEFGDYDNDGDLDVLIKSSAAKIFRNDNGIFVNSGISLTIGNTSIIKWGDFDKDGDLDLAVIGTNISIYKNVNNSYSLYYNSPNIFYYSNCDANWGDADNDGDLDLITTGVNGSGHLTWLLINTGSGFNSISTSFDAINFQSVVWGDFDNDGDQDLLFTTSTNPVIYVNDSLNFTLSNYVFPAVPIIANNTIYLSSSIWADYDLDGDLDVVTMGRQQNTPYSFYTKIYQNQNGSYVLSPIAFQSNMQGQMIKVADVENDGDLDFAAFSTSYPWMQANNSGTYTNTYFSKDGYLFEGLQIGSAAFADYDNDGYLDILHTGRTDLNPKFVAFLLSGHSGSAAYTSNTAPAFPTTLSSSVQGSDVQFSWNRATDGQTPAAALTYNLRVGKTPGGNEVLSAMSASDGNLLIPVAGNCNLLNSKTIKGIKPGTYYWSVQTVDNGLMGSAFAPEQTFTINSVLLPPTLISPVNIAQNQNYDLNFSWNKPTGAENYQFQLAYDQDFIMLIKDKQTLDTTLVVDSLRLETNYYWRVRAFSDSITSSWSEIRNFKTSKYFTDIIAPLFPYTVGLSADWGDYDNDGDLDLITTGYLSYPDFRTKIYNNNNGVFTDIHFVCDSFGYSIAKWVDIDNDNDLDIFFNGVGPVSQYASRIYKNNNGSFQKSNIIIAGNAFSDIDFIDNDNDGDLDIVASSAESGTTYDDALYLLTNKYDTAFTFSNYSYGQGGAVACMDYDNDGDFDFFTNGKEHSFNLFSTYLLKKTDTTFSLAGHNIVRAYQGGLTPFDYDNDGDLDLLMSGMIDDYSMQLVTRVYKNTNGIFTDINAGLTGTSNSSLLWGDYDNDGDADIIAGGTGNVYRNDNTVFKQTGISFTGGGVKTALGDYDNDGDLDIVAVGSNNVKTQIFKNNSYIFNTIPVPSPSKEAIANGGDVSLTWDKFIDSQTPSDGLSYNIYVKSIVDSSFVISPSANITTGYRKIAAVGNVQNHISYTLKNVKPGLYLWSVQGIDNTFSGSQFAPPDTLAILKAPVLSYPGNISVNINPETAFSWFKSTYAFSYQMQISIDPNFNTLLIDSIVSDTALTVRLDVGKTYFWRVRAKRNNSTSNWSATWEFSTVPMETIYLSNLIICKGATVDLTVNSSSVLLDSLNTTGTQYAIELIDHAQNNTIIIDTVSIAAMDTLIVTIPDTVSIGSNYRFRIRCLDSSIVCIENNEDISIINYAYFNISQDSVIRNCENTSLTLNILSDPHVPYNWYLNGIKTAFTDSVISITQAGHYSLSADSLICPSFSDTVNVISYKPAIVISPMKEFQICTGDSVNVDVNFNTNYTYNWSTGDTVPSITIKNFGKYFIVVKDSNQCVNSDSVTVAMSTDCNVWPGDTDNDSLVSNYDLLPIGLYFSQTGAPRSSISNAWQSYPATNWGILQANGADIKHADCDGNGIINNDDTLAIHINFSSVHNIIANNFTYGRIAAPDLYIVTSSNSYNPGDWIDAEIWTGNSTLAVSNLYGIAFNISYDPSLVQSGTESLTYPNSWLATPGANAITFEKTDASSGIAYGAITRIDHNNANGFGKIADFKFQAKSSITSNSILYLSVSNYKANDAAGALQEFNTPIDSVLVSPLTTDITEGNTVGEIIIAPNPFTNQTTITFNKAQKNATIKIVDVLGKELKTINYTGKQLTIEREEIPNGIYFLQIIDEKNNIVNKRIIIQ